MKKRALLFLALVSLLSPPLLWPATPAEIASWERRAGTVTITRDNWGIAHVHGKTDADAVFGLLYAQAEDDFNRVETNYINAMGRLAEAEGEGQVYRDLRMKLFIDPSRMKAAYAESPEWLKALMRAYADGLNYYLYTHPAVKPRVITRFEPWMALTFTEGSIGADIERIGLQGLESFYGTGPRAEAPAGTTAERQSVPEPTGSNGFAIAPSNSASGHALLWINPHTSFYFRAEVQVTSDEGLDAYGAVTWGQFFVYQGFNERAGWMHTSSGVDSIDEYFETIVRKGHRVYYRHGSQLKPVRTATIVVPYKSARGLARKTFTAFYTEHGPIVREADGRWISVSLMQEPMKALIQSYTRTKARSYRTFRETMELHTNSSNNTVFADADGNIAYFHANFIPRRDTRFDWTRPVDGSDPATDWKGVLSIDETPGLLNPRGGWLYNTNNWPWSAAGPDSPKQADYPAYVESGEENPRGLHAVRVLSEKKDFTMDSLTAAAFDPLLTEFEILVPPLIEAYDKLPATDSAKAALSEPVELLRAWDRRWSVTSVPTTVAVFWGEELWKRSGAAARKAGLSIYDFMATKAAPEDRLNALVAACETLKRDFGTWKTPWGEVNRFQRLTDDIAPHFDDSRPSIPVGFTSSRWGSLASFGARAYDGTKKWYGTTGNSFLAVVEFGERVRAKAVTAGGESGDPASPHFKDQAERYATGALRDVYFYPEDLKGHVERQYHPGER